MSRSGKSATSVTGEINREDFPIPNWINLLVLLASTSLAILLLFGASRMYRLENWWALIGIAVLFSFINNTNFAFLHEAVHGSLNSNRRANDALGVLAGAFFPTSFTLQQFYHLGHHCRNRTDAEMFDLYYPGDNLWVKRAVIYSMPTGIYWLSAVMGNLLFLLCPWLLKVKWFRQSRIMEYSSFDSMLSGIPDSSRIRRKICWQILLVGGLQAGIVWSLNVAWPAWLVCYWLFGMNWGSLQYTDHAFSKRDVREGAWNLRVNPITRLIFLNYHLHLAHHLYPHISWLYLPKLVSEKEERPYFWKNFLKLMSGPYPADEPSPSEIEGFRDLVYGGTSMPKPSASAAKQ